MSVLPRVFLLTCLVSSAALRAQASSTDSLSPIFRRLISARLTAAKHADTAAYRRLADPQLVFVDEDGVRTTVAERLRQLAAHGAEDERVHYDVDSLHVSVMGDMALVDYLGIEHEPLGPREHISSHRTLDTYLLRGGQWRLLRHADVLTLALPAPVKLTAAALDEYVGRYEWWPGYIDTITRQGNQLFDQSTGEKKASLNLAATPESFYIAGDPALLVFVRDKTGRVVGYVLHWPDGQVMSARRLR